MKYKDTPCGRIPESWGVSPISEVTESVTDYVANGSFASLAENVTYKDTEDVAVLIRLVDYNNGFKGHFVFIDEHAYEFLGKSKLYGGEIIISNVGAVGTVFRCPHLQYKMSLAPNAIMVKFKESDDFYYFWLRSHAGQHMLHSIVTGSAQPKFNKTNFRDMLVPVPPRDQQDKIVAILQPLEDKIEQNKRINENLEQQAQAMYQHWFGSQHNGILSDICSYSKEKVPVSTLNLDAYYSTENMLPDKAGAVQAAGLPTVQQTTLCHKGDTLVSNIRPYFKKIVYCPENCGCSTDVLCFAPKEERYSAYLYNTLYADRFFDFMVAGSKGTKMPRGDKSQIMTLPIAIPTDEELDMFNVLAEPILKQIEANRAESKRLSSVRDTLLPKLISGEIEI